MKKDTLLCTIFSAFFAAAFFLMLFWQKPDFLMDERRAPTPFPELSAESLWNGRFMSRFEKYATDTVPFRSELRRLKSLLAIHLFRKKDNHGIYQKDSYLAKMEYPLKPDNIMRAAQRFRHVYQKHLNQNNRVFFSVIPDKNYFLAEPSGHLQMDYQKLEEIMTGQMDFARYINLFDLLEIGDYYQTDTHWRQEKILDVAERLAGEMGAKTAEDFSEETANQRFYGVYYGQSALPAAPEKLSYLTDPAIEQAKVFDIEHNRPIGVYDLAAASGKDGYEMFLSGALSLIRIENAQAPKDKKLVIFRDSFGSALAPLLIPSYSQIYLADIRYIHPNQLEKYIDFENSDILFLYSTLVLNNSETIK